MVATRSGTLSVRTAGNLKQFEPLKNAVVRLRGIGSGQFSESGQLVGARIFVAGIDAVEIEEPARSDPFAAQHLSLTDFFRFRAEADFMRRTVLSGTVTWAPPGGGFYLTSEGLSVFVQGSASDPTPIGSRVEAAGYLEAGRSRFAPYLDNAIVRVVGHDPAPIPIPHTVEEIRYWNCDASLITVRAALIHAYYRENRWRSIWQTSGNQPLIFEATESGAPPKIPPTGSTCALTGIARIEMNDHREPVGLTLSLRGPEDRVVLSEPPWWSGARARRGALVLGLLVAVSGGWALILRRRVEQQTALVRTQLLEQQHLQQRNRDLFDNNPHPMWVFDPATLRYLDVNATAVRKYGYTREEFLQMTLLDMRTKEEQARLLDQIKNGNALHDQDASPWTHVKRDGTLISVEITSRGIPFDGKPARMVLAHDVTERLKAETALRETEARFRRVIESNLIGIVFLDAAANVTDANDTFLKMLGLPRGAVAPGQLDVKKLIAPESLKLTRNAMDTLRRGETIAPFEIECVRVDQSRLPALVGAASLGEDAGFVGFVVDISKEAALEQQVRLAQKMEAVGLLAGGVAHDFNNLLQVIQGYTLLSLEAAGANSDVREYLDHVKSATDRAAQLTRQLLAFSRQQDLQETDLDLGETLQETLKLVRRIIGEHIQVNYSADPGLVKMRADKGRIEQVILNLCVNARDAMPNGGTLTIHASNAILTPADLGSGAGATPGPYVCVRVTDTGCGMDSATTSRIFEPFFTTKPKDKGTGLGLSVVYGIIEKHKGIIRVRSQVGVGTTFHIYFPATTGPEQKIFPFNKTEIADKTGMETILLVEDEPAVRLLASRILERAGYDVRLAADGVEACSVFEKNAADIDLILMDVIMPKMGGREAYERIAQKRRDVPVIFCTGYSERELGADFLQRHQLDLLPKPYRPDELLTRVRDRLGALGKI